jgi:hypothetical protein
VASAVKKAARPVSVVLGVPVVMMMVSGPSVAGAVAGSPPTDEPAVATL